MAAALSAALVCLLLGISQGNAWGWGSARMTGLLVGAVLLLRAFGAVELRVAEPPVDLRLLRRPAFAAANVLAFLVGGARCGSITLIPRFVRTPAASGYGFGASPNGAGLVTAPGW